MPGKIHGQVPRRRIAGDLSRTLKTSVTNRAGYVTHVRSMVATPLKESRTRAREQGLRNLPRVAVPHVRTLSIMALIGRGSLG